MHYHLERDACDTLERLKEVCRHKNVCIDVDAMIEHSEWLNDHLSNLAASVVQDHLKQMEVERLEQLRSTTAAVPLEMIRVLSHGFMALYPVVHKGLSATKPEHFAWALSVGSFALGFSLGLLPANERSVSYVHHALLVEAGRSAARKRTMRYSALKNWALEHAKSLKGSPKQQAKRLALQLPAALVNVSADPERLIYEAILLQNKNKATKQNV